MHIDFAIIKPKSQHKYCVLVTKHLFAVKCYLIANNAPYGWILPPGDGIVCPRQRKWRHAKYHRGTITPCNLAILKGGTYSHLLYMVTRMMQSLTQAQQETFEKFKDYASELNGAKEVAAFALGFKLGIRLAPEVMISPSDITEEKMN